MRARLIAACAVLGAALAACAPADAGALAQQDSAAGRALIIMARLEPDSLEVGEPAVYTLRIESPRGASDPVVEWKPEPFEVLDAMAPEKRTEGDRAIEVRRYRVATYQLEHPFLPPPRILAVAEAETLEATADTLPVVFRSTLASASDTTLAPMKPPRAFPRRIPWILLGALALAAAAAYAGHRLWRRYRRRPPPAVVPAAPPLPVDTRPAHAIAFAALDRLEAERLPQQGKIREHSSELASIVRCYLSKRYSFDAIDSTSFEILRAVATRPLTVEDRSLLRELLSATDWVKFAKGIPSVEEALALLGQARLFVERTRERDAAPVAAVGTGT